MKVGDKYICKKDFIVSDIFAKGKIYSIHSIYDRGTGLCYNEYKIGTRDFFMEIIFMSDRDHLTCFLLNSCKNNFILSDYFESVIDNRRKKLDKLNRL